MTLTAHDAAGNARDLHFDVTVRLAAPVAAALGGIGAAVPGAGEDPRIAADAKFTALGIPAVADDRSVAFLAKWKSGKVATSGIFAGVEPKLLVATGDDAPGLAGAKFKTLQDPLLGPDGTVAFAATVAGSGIRASSDLGVWLSEGGGLALVLREGAQIAGAPEKFTLKSVTGMSLRNGELLVMAKLAPVARVVTAANDSVLLRVTPAGATVLVREGDPLDLHDGFPASPVLTISSLLPTTGAAGQGRWQADGAATTRVTLKNKRSVVLCFAADGAITRTLAVGDGVPNLPDSAVWNSLSLPGLEPSGHGAVARGTLSAQAIPGLPPVVTPKTDTILAYSPDHEAAFSMFAREGSPAPGAEPASFSVFQEPLASDSGDVAFSATLAGPQVSAGNNAGIWWGDPAAPRLLARTNAFAPDTAGAASPAKWSKFISLALPSGPDAGPIVLAQVRGTGLTAKNNVGLWAVDSNGTLRQMLRTGDIVNGQPVLGIQGLTGVTGALGATRGFNARGTIAVRVTHPRNGQSIVRIDIPEGATRIISGETIEEEAGGDE